MIFEPHRECLDAAGLETLQAGQFGTMVRMHLRHIPLYRKRLEDVFGPSGIDTATNTELLHGLSKIKPVFRDEYQSLNAGLLAKLDRNIFFIDSSSGSTGSPKSRFCSVADDLHDTALCTRAFASFGIGAHDRVLTFDLADLTYYTQFTKSMQDLGVKTSFFYSARSDFEQSMREALSFKPTTIITMPSILKRCLHSFFDYCKKAPQLKRLVYFGEPLEDDIRKLLFERYAVECFSLYGSTDIGWIAAECEAHDGMHLFADSVVLHVLPDDSSSSSPPEGAALFTSLFQTGKPNLRYSNGDRLEVNTAVCRCGRSTPRVKVTCRDTDLFTLMGTKLSIMEIQQVIYGNEEVSCFFQVVLTEREGVTIFSVRLPKHLENASSRIMDGLMNTVGLAFYTCINVVAIELEFVDDHFFSTKKIPRLVDSRDQPS